MRRTAEPGRRGDLVSVIMPCFNSEKYLPVAVESVYGQTYSNVELIVVDDGSTDRSREILRRYGERITVIEQINRGPYPARNAGLRLAQGAFIAFLDADDWWDPTILAKLHDAVTNSGAEVAYCGWQNVGQRVVAEPFVPRAYEEGDPVAHFLRTSCPWPIHAALVRRSLVDQLGGFSERRYSSMDYDFWLRALAFSRRIKRVPEVLAFYRWHSAEQVSAVKWRQVLDALDAQKNFIRSNPGLVAHIPPERIKEFTEGRVLAQAYQAWWKRDLVSAQKLFRHVAANGSFRLKDLIHVASSLLPMRVLQRFVRLADGIRA